MVKIELFINNLEFIYKMGGKGKHLTLYEDLKFISKFVKKGFKTIRFYPEYPHEAYVINKLCHLLGYKLTNNIKEYAIRFDLVFQWKDKTFIRKDYSKTNR